MTGKSSAQSDTGNRSFTLRIVGAAPMVHHSGLLADPLSAPAKELRKISKKRAKTDADLEQMAKVEWYGGLWLYKGRPCIPGEAIEAAFIGAARKSKRGPAAKAGMVSPEKWPLEYEGPGGLGGFSPAIFIRSRVGPCRRRTPRLLVSPH